MNFTVGTQIKFHPNVNNAPYLGQCVVCGRKVGKSSKLVRFDFDGKIDPTVADHAGWKFAVGAECAKDFDPNVFSK